ncbi:hypothetical protein GCM10008088_27580 [Mesonia mobilis]|uniref:Uncharacterized protein n=1 Tax=Mesonia mobilis TaxID=369791 RepID=A0ABQ3C1B9_9FLAO|nr:hypothetical protein GCM10008088_27580 [Mesonia mobilis]
MGKWKLQCGIKNCGQQRITTIAALSPADTTAQAEKSVILAILVSKQSATDCYTKTLALI